MDDITSPAPVDGVLTRREMYRACSDHIATIPADHLDILEAGCGRYWHIELHGKSHRIVGVDMDQLAVEARQKRHGDLDEVIIGDIVTVELPRQSFDVIYCAFLLEHLPDAAVVLERFARWLRPQGKIVFTIPDRDSVHGFCTRLSPHWFHVWYKRHFTPLGKNAGKPGFGPYRTYYDPVLGDEQLQAFCSAYDLEIRDRAKFLMKPRAAWLELFMRTLSALSFGALAWRHDDLLYVLGRGRS